MKKDKSLQIIKRKAQKQGYTISGLRNHMENSKSILDIQYFLSLFGMACNTNYFFWVMRKHHSTLDAPNTEDKGNSIKLFFHIKNMNSSTIEYYFIINIL